MSNYRYEGYGVIRDLKSDIPYPTDDIVDLLEEKDQRITELQKQLKSQPAEIVKKIMSYYTTPIYDRPNAHTEVSVLLHRLDTILKEYGGKDE